MRDLKPMVHMFEADRTMTKHGETSFPSSHRKKVEAEMTTKKVVPCDNCQMRNRSFSACVSEVLQARAKRTGKCEYMNLLRQIIVVTKDQAEKLYANYRKDIKEAKEQSFFGKVKAEMTTKKEHKLIRFSHWVVYCGTCDKQFQNPNGMRKIPYPSESTLPKLDKLHEGES